MLERRDYESMAKYDALGNAEFDVNELATVCGILNLHFTDFTEGRLSEYRTAIVEANVSKTQHQALRLQHDRSQSVRSAAMDRFGRSDIPMHRLRSPFLIGISFRLVTPCEFMLRIE